MDDKEEQPSMEFQKGFNDGYILAKHEPEISNMLKTVKGDTDQLRGLRSGIAQVSKEQNKYLPKWMQDHEKSKDKTDPKKDIDLDRE